MNNKSGYLIIQLFFLRVNQYVKEQAFFIK